LDSARGVKAKVKQESSNKATKIFFMLNHCVTAEYECVQVFNF